MLAVGGHDLVFARSSVMKAAAPSGPPRLGPTLRPQEVDTPSCVAVYNERTIFAYLGIRTTAVGGTKVGPTDPQEVANGAG